MLDFFDELTLRDQFIDIDFDYSPFQFLSGKGIKLNSIIDTFLKDLKEKPQINTENSDLKEKERKITFIYENEQYIIFRNPIKFKLFYDNNIIFKAYNETQLNNILIKLSVYYYFYTNSHFENNIKIIMSSENIEEIILYPFFTQLFFMLNYTIDFKVNKIKIKKELLEPLQLYIEKEEVLKNITNSANFDESLLDEELIFILNQERRQFIDKLNQFVKKTYIIEPMKIIGNDGVGKSLTLQLYSSIKLEGYNKIYFNLKLFERYGFINYFFIELIKGFLSIEENINDDIKNYINCVCYMQKLKNLNRKNFFEVLKELKNYIKIINKKYIIILDQFKYEYITDKDFEIFKSQLDKEQIRLIICCSLNDGKIKKKMFKDYEEDILWLKDNSSQEEKISQAKEIERNEIKTDDYDDNSTEENKINLKNMYILRKRKAANELFIEDVSNKKIKEDIIKSEITSEKKEDKKINIYKNEEASKKDEKIFNNKIIENKYKNTDLIFEPRYIYKLPVVFPVQKKNKIIYDKTPVNIYYNDLVDLKQIIKEKEPEEIFNFMSNFKYLPKYYKKFNIFRLSQNLNNIKDIFLIIENFKKEISNKISKNINNFYSKEFEFDSIYDNIYKYILKFKKKINKYNDKTITFKKLYNISKKYPMKYIMFVQEDNSNSNSISFDNSIINKRFKINYSFPFIEYVLNNMIDEYDNDTKIAIKNMSGSAFGYALELKIRKFLNELPEKIEIRKVWSLNSISEKVKNSKLKEIQDKTLNSFRFYDLEDICKIKPLKDSNYFYFHPENQDNYLIDSILLINHGNNNFSIVVFQITKYKSNDEIKTKKYYSDYIKKNVKTKFEKLYNINIIDIYFYFILSNEHKENVNTCINLKNKNIKFIFYSIEQRCLLKQRNGDKIDSLLFLKKKNALIYSKNSDYCDENNIKIDPLSISIFEDKLYNLSEKYETINYEKIREKFFTNNFGLKINKQLRNSIIETLKGINQNKNNFYLLFLFCFPFNDFYKYYNLEDDLIFILKYENILYFCYKDLIFEIDRDNNKLKRSRDFRLDIKDIINFKREINYNEEEIDIFSIKDLKENYIVYLYKIYYIGDIKDN